MIWVVIYVFLARVKFLLYRCSLLGYAVHISILPPYIPYIPYIPYTPYIPPIYTVISHHTLSIALLDYSLIFMYY